MARIVGATEHEVACMGTLTSNLHFMLASFYRVAPDDARRQVIIEEGAFSSDIVSEVVCDRATSFRSLAQKPKRLQYALESHIHWRNLDPSETIVRIPVEEPAKLLSNSAILSIIDRHASTAALLLLSGVQFQTGQLLDIPGITAYARERGITVGWDLAHAVGNVELLLHDWNVDFAVWCSYKYLNAGPGATAGIFVHERHGKTDAPLREGDNKNYLPRLAGWWGMAVSDRFAMGKCEFSIRHPNPIFPRKWAISMRFSFGLILVLNWQLSSRLPVLQASKCPVHQY